MNALKLSELFPDGVPALESVPVFSRMMITLMREDEENGIDRPYNYNYPKAAVERLYAENLKLREEKGLDATPVELITGCDLTHTLCVKFAKKDVAAGKEIGPSGIYSYIETIIESFYIENEKLKNS